MHLGNNPYFQLDKFIVPGNLCQKCRRGKIRHGFIVDEICAAQLKDMYSLC